MAQKESTSVSAKEHLQLENQPCIVTFITGNVPLDSTPLHTMAVLLGSLWPNDGQLHESFDSHE